MEAIIIVGILIIVCAIAGKIITALGAKKNTPMQNIGQQPGSIGNGSSILPYEKKMLLTKTEYGFWKCLKQKCDEKGFIICPKVRMEDFLSVTVKDKKQLMKYRGYIKSRHIDFMICDSALHILAGLELDDRSHNSASAQKTDLFKNQVFTVIGLPLFRVIIGGESYETQLNRIFATLCPAATTPVARTDSQTIGVQQPAAYALPSAVYVHSPVEKKVTYSKADISKGKFAPAAGEGEKGQNKEEGNGTLSDSLKKN